MIRQISTLFLLFGVSILALAQSPQDWIDFNQSYIKLKVAEDGWYRVTANELQQEGFPISSVAASQIQLFRKGQEVAIRTQAVSGGALDYFEFWGEKNNGTTDTELYKTNAQPHSYYNLFSDTATYFLTWSTTSNHLRIQTNTQNDNTGLVPKTSHVAVSHRLQTTDYATGRLFGGSAGNDFQLSEYDTGEGWTGNRIAKGSSQDFSFTLTNLESSKGTSKVEVVAIGRNSLQHVVTVLAGPIATSLTTVGTFTFDGYTSYRHVFDVDPAWIGANGELVIRLTVTGVAGASDFVSFSSVKLHYPQTLSIPAGESKIFNFEPDGTARYYLQIATPTPENYRYFDVTNPAAVLRLTQNQFTGRSEVVLPNTAVNRKVLAVAGVKTVPVIKRHTFDPIDLNNKSYLILTHRLLRNHPNGTDPIADYAAYRSSSAGGSFAVEIAEINDIYDQFNYGDPSVLAIRRLFAQAYQNHGITTALFLAKGRTINQNLYRKTYANPDSLPASEVFIPTYGVPGGDNMYSIGLNPQEPLIPVMATGRINAWKPEQVTAYLEKVKTMEALPYDQLWRKNLIHLSGGTTLTELSSFASYIQDFKEVAEGDFLGGRALNKNKQTSAISEQFDISTEVNQGVGYITVFGHSSNTVTDVEIGKPSNVDFNYNNAGKYPMIIVNGCKAGEIFGNTISFGEDWISYPQKGAIGFLAHADQASSANLKRFTDRVYEIGFANEAFFGYSTGKVLIEASRQYYLGSAGTSEASQTQVQQTLFQGDPALVFFGPSLPDFTVIAEKITAESIYGGQLLAQHDSLILNIPVVNYGRTREDSMALNVQRTYPDGVIENYQFVLPSVKYTDTLRVYISNTPERLIEGQNQVTVSLDPLQEIEELNELNNTGNATFYISSGSTQHLLPYDLAVIPEDTIRLIWQSSDPLEPNRGYLLEIDTVISFNSSYYKSFTIQGANLLMHQLDVSGLPAQTSVYWRTKFAEVNQDSDTIAQVSSFTYSAAASPGWGQFSFSQFAQNELNQLIQQPNSMSLEFATTEIPVSIKTQGTAFYNYENLQVNINGGDQLATTVQLDPKCLDNTFNAIIFDKNNGQLKRPIAIPNQDYENFLVCGRLPQMIYNFTSTEILVNRRIEELVSKMPSGDQVVLFNIDSVAYSSFDAAIQTSLTQLGIDATLWSTLTDGQPLVIFGQKGAAAGTATVIRADGSALQPKQQTITASQQIVATADEGTFISPVVGPATSWQNLHADITLSGSDFIMFEVIGISSSGEEAVLLPEDELASSTDLSFIDAASYPYLYLRARLSDIFDLTPPLINRLSVDFTGSPEGILITDQKESITVQEGQMVSFSGQFINVSEIDYSDSLTFQLILTNTSSDQQKIETIKYPPLFSGDTLQLTFEDTSVGFTGTNNISLSVQSPQAERVTINNQLTFGNYATVTAESINPILDVTIDGRYILDGEIVSANPRIQISFKDENPYLYKSDTTGIEVFLQWPNESTPKRVSFSDPAIIWSPAAVDQPFEISYQPTLIQDGVYILSVEASDETGNSAGTEPYELSFEVVNQSTITNFFPYPNPFSTQCRFVFTLTGSVIPDDLMIQVMTLSGRVVKTIDEMEIGPIHIGNNITEYAWDGRDEYGDLLANGVYLYRVIVKSGNQTIDQRNSSADVGFKNGIGKLYILR